MTRLLVGLTGGIAGGKSTVGRMLAADGCLVVDADLLVAELYAPGAAGARAVAAIAGEEILDETGAVDRAALAERLFRDAELRAAVEAAVHPLVRQRFARIAGDGDAPIAVLEATLLVEAGYRPDFDVVVTVEADERARLERAVERGLSEEQARARLTAQGDGAERRAGADLELRNDGSLAELERAVAGLRRELDRRLAAKRRREEGR